jgi:hypothetical protein
MPQRQTLLAASTVAFLVSVGGASVLFNGCSPSAPGLDASVDAPVCNPDSGDPAGCACDPGTVKQQTCYTGPPGTEGKGFCQTGLRSCTQNGTYTTCVGEVTPVPEVCNLADDDCDGIIDDLPEIADAAVLGRCTSPSCSPNFGDAAITCWGPDPGICGAGTKACAPGPKGGTPTGCNEFVHTPTQEICNGIDDDCNGLVDDGLDQEGTCDVPEGSTWPPDANPTVPDAGITQVLGECVHGNLTCVPTGCGEHGCADAGDVCFPSQPAVETCDGKDNDCNGIIDDHACANNASEPYCCTYLLNQTDSFCYPSDLGVSEPGYYLCHNAN